MAPDNPSSEQAMRQEAIRLNHQIDSRRTTFVQLFDAFYGGRLTTLAAMDMLRGQPVLTLGTGKMTTAFPVSRHLELNRDEDRDARAR